MSNTTIQPQGEALQKALKELALLVEEKPDVERWKLLEEVSRKFDLTPKESDFLQRQFRK